MSAIEEDSIYPSTIEQSIAEMDAVSADHISKWRQTGRSFDEKADRAGKVAVAGVLFAAQLEASGLRSAAAVSLGVGVVGALVAGVDTVISKISDEVIGIIQEKDAEFRADMRSTDVRISKLNAPVDIAS